jgi:hypothetical protein
MHAASVEQVDTRLDRIKVIYTDMDGTLVGPGGSLFAAPDGSLTMTPARAVFKTLQRDVDVVIISGRTRVQLKENARTIGFRNYIAELGCEIVYDLGKKIVYNIGDMPLKEGQRPLDAIEKSGALDLIFREFPNQIRYYTPWSENVQDNALLVGNIDEEQANRLLEEHGYTDLRMTDNGGVPPEPDFRSPHCYHLLPAAAGKRSAVQKDKEIRGLRTPELVGIGESIEDMEISPEVGVYFVVRNGAEDDPRVMEAAEERENAFLLEGRMGLGWAEAVAVLEQLEKL